MEWIDGWLRAWLDYSRAQIADSSFWWGALTTILGLLGLMALPAARGAVGPLVGTLSRLFTGYYFYWRRSYPDLISASQCILLRRPDGETEMCVDTIFGERTLQAVIGNPFKAWLLRQTAEFATDADPLIRLNEYGPKRRRWFRRRMRARDIAALRRQIRRRYRALYAPLVRAYAEHYTNPGSIRASRGETMIAMRIILAKTYTGDQKHHRLHGVHEHVLLGWPEQCPLAARASYGERHALMLKLRDVYRRAPWRFDFIDEFTPMSEAPENWREIVARRRDLISAPPAPAPRGSAPR